MNILHLSEQTAWRGGERQAHWLMRGLIDRGHRVAIAGRVDAPFLDAPLDADVPRLVCKFRSELDIASALRVAQTVRTFEIDILHAHSSHAHTQALIARRFAGRGKVVVSRRVGFPPKRHALNRIKYKAVDRLISVAHTVDDVLAAFGVPDSKRAVVHSAVDPDRINVDPVPRRALGIDDEAPLLVTAGALEPAKDHANLLHAMTTVREAFPNTRLLIAGKGRLADELTALCAELELTDTVTFLGHREDAPALMRAANVYVSSSRFEGLGTSVLEALAMGVPVVATEAGGAAEMVVPDETGRLVPIENAGALAGAILATLRDKAETERMANAARNRTREQFSIERMVAGTEAVYRDVLDREDECAI